MKTGEESAHEDKICPIPNSPSGAPSLYRSFNLLISSAVFPWDEDMRGYWPCHRMKGNNFIWCSGFLLILLVESIVHKVPCVSFWSSACGLISASIQEAQISVDRHLYLKIQGAGWFFRAGPQPPTSFNPQYEDCATTATPYRLQKEARSWKHPRILPPSFREKEEVWWVLGLEPGDALLPKQIRRHPRKAYHEVRSEQVSQS